MTTSEGEKVLYIFFLPFPERAGELRVQAAKFTTSGSTMYKPRPQRKACMINLQNKIVFFSSFFFKSTNIPGLFSRVLLLLLLLLRARADYMVASFCAGGLQALSALS